MADARPTTSDQEQAATGTDRPRTERQAEGCHPTASARRRGRRSEASPGLGFAEGWRQMMAGVPDCAEAFLSEDADAFAACCGPAVDGGRPSRSSDPTEAAQPDREPQATPTVDQPEQ